MTDSVAPLEERLHTAREEAEALIWYFARHSPRGSVDLHRKSGELPSHLSRHTFALHRTDAAQI